VIITLIRPNLGINTHTAKPFVDKGAMEPLEMAVLAALTPSKHQIKFFDDRIETINYDEPTHLVGITVEIYTARRAYEIATEYRKRNVKVVLGGMHPTLMPEEAACNADAVVAGDAETIWEKVIYDAEHHNLQPYYYGQPGIPHPKIIPRKDIYQLKNYMPYYLIQFGRGCRYACSYCAISVYFNKNCYYRSVNDVIAEIEKQGTDFLFFVDDNIVAQPQLAKELFKALIPLKIKWMGQGSLDMTKDLELMRLMQKSGCLGNVIGFETVSEKGLKLLNKTPNIGISNNFSEQIKILNDHGLSNWAAFVIGHDSETEQTMQETLQFALKHKFAFAAFNILMPYPKTELYNQLHSENRLLYDEKWWIHNDYKFNTAAFIPKNMTPEQLTKQCAALKKEWSSFSSIITRTLNIRNLKSAAGITMLLRLNILFRIEALKKHKLKLGYTSKTL